VEALAVSNAGREPAACRAFRRADRAATGKLGLEESGYAGLGDVEPDQAGAEGVAETGSLSRAQRQAGLRLTAMEMPMPEPRHGDSLRELAVFQFDPKMKLRRVTPP
jgi:hypothetical protein